MTTAEAAKALGVNDSRVRQLIREDGLPALKVGRDWLIEPRALERWVRVKRKPKRMGRPLNQPPEGAE